MAANTRSKPSRKLRARDRKSASSSTYAGVPSSAASARRSTPATRTAPSAPREAPAGHTCAGRFTSAPVRSRRADRARSRGPCGRRLPGRRRCRAGGRRRPARARRGAGHAGGHEYTSTAHEDQKFGLSISGGRALEALRAVLARPELDLIGVHSHIGSQILDPSSFEVAARRVLELRAELATLTGHLMPEVDLAGGVRDPEAPAEVPLDPVRVAKGVAGVVDATCAELGTTVPRISVEPGRAIVGPTTLTLYTVGTVKPVTVDERLTRLYVSVDGGMSDNLRPALYGARYTACLLYTSDAADEEDSVDLGGRRIIKKKKKK